MANPVGKLIEKEVGSAAHSLYRSAIQSLSDILDNGTPKELKTAISKVVKEFKAQGVTRDIAITDASDFGIRKITLPTNEVRSTVQEAPIKPVFKPTAEHVRGGKSEGAKATDYHKSLMMFDKLSNKPDANPEAIADEIDLMSKKYGKEPERMMKDLLALKQRGEKVGASIYTKSERADTFRAAAVEKGVPESTANRFQYEEGKYETHALNQGTESGDPAKTRSYRVGIKLTAEERKAMGASKMWERTSADLPVGPSKDVGAPEVYYVFAKTPEEATADLAKVMREIHSDMGSKGKGAKVADPKLAIKKKEVVEPEVKPEPEAKPKVRSTEPEAKTESTPIEETPEKSIEPETAAEVRSTEPEAASPKEEVDELSQAEDQFAEVDGAALQRELDGIPEEQPPVTPEERVNVGFESKVSKPVAAAVTKSGGVQRKLAAGVLGAGALTGGALMMAKKEGATPPDTVTESSAAEAQPQGAAVDESKRRLSAVIEGNPDVVVKTVKTKGGDYNVYRKDSAMAQSFRDAYAKAKAGKAKVFKWNGNNYKVA